MTDQTTTLEDKLGSIVAVHKGRSFSMQAFLSWFFPGLITIFILLGIGLFRRFSGRVGYGPAAAETWARPWFVAAILLTIPLLILMLRHIRSVVRQVNVYRNGLTLNKIRAGDNVYLWSQIVGVTYLHIRRHIFGNPTRETTQVILHPSVGDAITLDPNIHDLTGLTILIKRAIFPMIKPQLIKSLRNGQWLYFGDIRINNNSLATTKQEIPWSKIHQVYLNSGMLVINVHNEVDIKVSISKIMNVDLLLQIIDEEITR